VTHFFVQLISLITLLSLNSAAFAQNSYTNEVETDVRFKKLLPIYLQHDLGDVTIQGWNQDLIRVRLKKTVIAEREDLAMETANRFALVSLETPTSIELRVGTPLGTDLMTKLRNRQKRKDIRVDLEIKAPINLDLTLVLGAEKNLKLSQWKGGIRINGRQGNLDLSKLKLSHPLHVHCPDCKVSAVESDASGSILAGNQKVELKKVKSGSKPLMVFSQNGEIELTDTEGDFQIRSVSGSLSSNHHQGDLHAQSESGMIRMDRMTGDVDAQSTSGNILYSGIKPGKLIELKSHGGSMDLSLPSAFSGLIDLQSIQSEVLCGFPFKAKKQSTDDYGPSIRGKAIGQIGSSQSTSIIAYSESGKIELKKKDATK
jgi:DUF4097 and DUF4098 domain-containing protein YvlB